MRKKYIEHVMVVDIDACTLINEPAGQMDMGIDMSCFITRDGTEFFIPTRRIAFVKRWNKVEIIGSAGHSNAAKDKAKGIPTPASTGGYD